MDVGRVTSGFEVLELQSLCIPNAIKHTVEVMQLVSASVRRAYSDFKESQVEIAVSIITISSVNDENILKTSFKAFSQLKSQFLC